MQLWYLHIHIMNSKYNHSGSHFDNDNKDDYGVNGSDNYDWDDYGDL